MNLFMCVGSIYSIVHIYICFDRELPDFSPRLGAQGPTHAAPGPWALSKHKKDGHHQTSLFVGGLFFFASHWYW